MAVHESSMGSRMNALAHMARAITGEVIEIPGRKPTLMELRIKRAEAIEHGERRRIAAYRKYLVQRGFVVMPARDFEKIATPHKPMREGVV